MAPRNPPLAAPPSLMMPVASEEAVRQAEILAMRQIADGLANTTRAVEKLADRMQIVGEDVSALKAQDVGRQIEKLEARMEACIAEVRREADHKLGEAETAIMHKIDIQARDIKEADQRVTKLLDESLKDRKALTVEIERIKGRLLPITFVGGAAASGLIAFLVDRLVKP